MIGRWLTVIVLIAAWTAASNHCVLGAIAPEMKSAQDECPFHAKHSAPSKQKQSSDAPCCKILRAVAAKSFAPKNVDLRTVDLVFAKLLVFAPPKISFHSATLDTGPPGITSFAELIGSMRAHAPPARI